MLCWVREEEMEGEFLREDLWLYFSGYKPLVAGKSAIINQGYFKKLIKRFKINQIDWWVKHCSSRMYKSVQAINGLWNKLRQNGFGFCARVHDCLCAEEINLKELTSSKATFQHHSRDTNHCDLTAVFYWESLSIFVFHNYEEEY